MSASLDGEIIGSYRRFGTYGPAYQVVGPDGPKMVRIVVLESGEELSCSVDEVRHDSDIWTSSVAPIVDP